MNASELLDFVIKKDRKWNDVVAKFSDKANPTAYASKILRRSAVWVGKPIYKTIKDVITVVKPAKKDIKHIYKA